MTPRGALLPALLALVLVLGARTAAAASPGDDPRYARLDALQRAWQGAQALALIDSLLPEARAHADGALLRDLLRRQGEIRVSMGDAPGAETPLRECLALSRAAGDTLGQCRALRWLGVGAEGRGHPDEAAALYADLLELAGSAGDAAHQGWAQVGLAWQDFQSGHNGSGAERYRQAIAHFAAAGERRGGIWAWNGLGITLSKLGDYPGAMDCFRRAAAEAGSFGDVAVESMALNNLGALAYDLGDPGDAALHFTRAAELQLRLGYPKGAVIPALNHALCLRQLGRLDEAVALQDSLLSTCRAEGWPDLEGRVLLQMADESRQASRPRASAARYREALALGEALPPRNALEARLGLAQALAASEGEARALEALESSASALASCDDRPLALRFDAERGRLLLALGRARAALQPLERVDAEARNLGLAGFRVEALARAAAAQRALGRPDSARVLLRRGAEVWEAERSLPRDPQWREQRGASGHLLYTDLAAALLAPREGMDVDARRREAFDALQRFKARTLRERMLGPGPLAAPARPPLTLDALQRETLQPGELLLDLYLGPERSVLFAVTRDDCEALLLPPEAPLAERLRALYGLVARPPVAGAGDAALVATAAAALRGQLFAGVEDLLAENPRVILVPDGPLNLLPPALLDAADAPAHHWLRVPAAAVLAQLRAARPAPARPLLALADASGGLPGALREVDDLAHRYRDVRRTRLSGGDVPGPALDALRGWGVLHLATHATVDDQNPWQSSLAGLGLTAADIARGRLDAELAVLAACESAGGRTLSGEGVLGLTGAFLSAGVPTVLATLWPVDDDATRRLMREFYAQLAAGRDAAAALAAAQAALRADPATAHPFFWAGAVLVGDGDRHVALEGRPLALRRWPQFLAGALGLVLLAIALRPSGKSDHAV
ncbi:MAG: CHAT domain-containing protein [Candidatus Latescibacteria bacterium]|nr:CHAT domain-containing protein [Candidatus Latescibacterota bacterium]